MNAPLTDTKTPPSQPLVWAVGALAIGIGFDRWADIPLVVSSATTVAALIAWAVLRWTRKPGDVSNWMKRLSAMLLLVALAGVGAARAHTTWRQFAKNDIGRIATFESTPVQLRAIAMDAGFTKPPPAADPLQPVQMGGRTQIMVRITALHEGDAWQPMSGETRLFVEGQVPQVGPGDEIEILAKLQAIEPPRNPGEFDFQAYERKYRRLCILQAGHPDCVTIVKAAPWWLPRRMMARTRWAANEALQTHVGETYGPLAAAMLLGNRDEISYERRERFFFAGVVHLLAISGLHVAILASCLWLLGRFGLLTRRQTITLVICFVIGYAVFTGARPPVLRATALIMAWCAASRWGRSSQGWNTLSLAGLFVLAWNPAELFSAGAQLSFLAVAVLMATARWWRPQQSVDPLDRLIARTRPWPVKTMRWLRRYLGSLWFTGAVVWLISLPLVIYHFRLAAPVALLVGPLMLPLAAVALISGFVVLLTAGVAPPVAECSGWICRNMLGMMETVIVWASDLPAGHFYAPSPAIWFVAIFYVVGLVLLRFPKIFEAKRWRLALSLIWIAGACCLLAGSAPVVSPPGKDELTCTFLSVGHGCATVIELPEGETILYDAGHMGPPRSAAESIAGYLWTRGVTEIDAIILSHADADHYNATPELLKRFRVKTVFVSPQMFQNMTPALTKLREAIIAAGADLQLLHAGDSLSTRSVMLSVWHPLDAASKRGEPSTESDNSNSIVVAIDHAQHRILLPGDLEKGGLQSVLASNNGECNLLMAPHHGSKNSEPVRVANWSRPRWLVISSGRGHDLSTTVDAFETVGAEVFATADGAVQLKSRKNQIEVLTWRQRSWQRTIAK